MQYLKSTYLLLFTVILMTGCAKRGNITGGLKDTIPPVLKMSFPKNYSTGFTGNEIRLEFDEYVKLKDINKQLVISPPLKKAPIITPMVASKTIKIKILDTLQPNTTYSFNFGQSIEDNNEANPYPQFKYIFSTGTHIDSLTLSGSIKDAYNITPDSFVSVMLYELNEKFSDSTIYSENPRYITNTLDSLSTFKLENLKAGKYLLVALKDQASNNKFDPKSDKIGFHKEPIVIPNDTLYEVELFKEVTKFRALKPAISDANKLIMGYEGDFSNTKITLRNGDQLLPSVTTRVPQKDSVNIWYKPIKADSLAVNISKPDYTQDYNVRIKAQKQDTLSFSARQSGVLPLREPFTVVSSRPVVKIDESLIAVADKDSAAVPFKTSYNEFNMEIKIDFDRQPLQKYSVKMFPGAVTDFYEKTNDTLRYNLTTKNTSDYGNLRVVLENVRRFPIIVELTDNKGKLITSLYSESATVLDFNYLDPAKYMLRVIYDDNKNKVWDTGSFLERRQTEEVLYFPKEIDVRANWDVDQPFTLP